MPNRFLRFALVQTNPVVGDIEGNLAQISAGLQSARAGEAAFVVFPELALTGYPPEDLLFKKHFIDANLAAVRALAPHTKGLTAVIGFVDRDPQGRLYSAAAVYSDGVQKGVFRKICLPNYGVFDEKRYFSAGEKPLVLENSRGRGRVALSVCEDIWPDDGPFLKAFGRTGADALVNLSASPYHFQKGKIREELVQKRAKRLKTHVLYCNLAGGQDELVFDGTSVVAGPSGAVIAEARRFAEDLLIVDVPIRGAAWPKPPKGVAVLRVPLGLRETGEQARPKRREAPKDEVQEVYDALVLATRDYVRKNRFKSAALGLSGGIDSAIVLAIACDALGPANVTAVSMPSAFSSKDTREDARTLAKNFGAKFMELPIEGLRGQYLDALKDAFAGTKPNETEENIQARIRGTLLMALSNKFGHLVLTTGNKSETATGYCTLYGDMAGGFAVLKDVPKTLVYKISRYRNKAAGKDLIPRSVIDRAPTAELRHNQKDSDSLPEYAALDPIVERYVELDQSADQIVAAGFGGETVHSVIRRIDGNEYKRRQSPPGIKITPKAFGRDRRMPITNAFLEKS